MARQKAPNIDWKLLKQIDQGIERARLARIRQAYVRYLSSALFRGKLPEELRKLTRSQLRALDDLLAG